MQTAREDPSKFTSTAGMYGASLSFAIPHTACCHIFVGMAATLPAGFIEDAVCSSRVVGWRRQNSKGSAWHRLGPTLMPCQRPMRDQRQLPEDRHSMSRVHSGSMYRGNARKQKLAPAK